MKNVISTQENNHPSNAFNNVFEEVLRKGARDLLQQAIENEVEEYINQKDRKNNGA